MSKKCERCGITMHSNSKGSLCRVCGLEKVKERHETMKLNAIVSRECTASETAPIPMMSELGFGKNRCEACGHAFKYDLSQDVACGYINDRGAYDLPPRPRPSADPGHCLYWSQKPSKAGWFTEAEKVKFSDYRCKPVIDMEVCKVYKNIDTASSLAGVPYSEIKKQCESTTDINADRRWRYVTAEERLIFKPKEV